MAATAKKAKKKTTKPAATKKKAAKKAASKKTASGKKTAASRKTAKKAVKKTRSAGAGGTGTKTAAGKKASATGAGKRKATAKKTRAGKTTKKTVKKTAKKTTQKKKAGKAAAGRSARADRTGRRTPARGEPRIQTAHSVIPGIAPYKPGKGEEYMNESQREHFREILLAWRSQLVSDITRTINSMQDESINHPDPTDRATQETDMSLELRSRDRERKLIKKIDDTIQRIDEDDYGYCDNCGVEIGIARLEARPTATLCIDCKTLDEIRERQMV